MIKSIIFDWKRTLYDPDSKALISGAEDLLKSIKNKGIGITLAGKGGEDMQKEVKRLGMANLFDRILFVAGKKDLKVFASLIIGEASDNFFVGDRVRSELEIGNRLGAVTIWVRHGKFANELPQNKIQKPDYTVSSLQECAQLLLNLL